LGQLRDILENNVEIRVDENGELRVETIRDGDKRVINVGGYDSDMSPENQMRLAAFLGEEAYRNGYSIGEIMASRLEFSADDHFGEYEDAYKARIYMGDRINLDYAWFYQKNIDFHFESYVLHELEPIFTDMYFKNSYDIINNGLLFTMYEEEIQQLTVPVELEDIVNTTKLAEIMLKNIDVIREFEGGFTADYITGLGDTSDQRQTALEKILNNLTVYAGLGQSQRVNELLDAYNIYGLNGMALGNDIYIIKEIKEMNEMSEMYSASVLKALMATIGHEAIHSVQYAAIGKNQVNAYSLTMPYDDRNRIELLAFRFSNTKHLDFKGRLDGLTSIFDNNPDWWKRIEQ